MDHYIEIKVLPDPEFNAMTLMSALFSKLHRALVEVGHGEIGVSFPHASKTPGDLLRLHANRTALERLMAQNWLKGLRDYSVISEMNNVPDTVQHVHVRRIQPKNTAARLRRAVQRGSLSELEAETLLAERKQMKSPFFQLQSRSTGQKFPLFVEQHQPQVAAVNGEFNSYGLSDRRTVPWF
jgi:CRISPR-associated endonuclease Csy4